MSKQTFTNDDGSQLEVESYTNQEGSHAIVVHEYDADGEHTGHVTDPSNNSGVHVHEDEDNSERWEGGNNPDTGESNPSPVNGLNEDGEVETYY
jgi:hypothetical protein